VIRCEGQPGTAQTRWKVLVSGRKSGPAGKIVTSPEVISSSRLLSSTVQYSRIIPDLYLSESSNSSALSVHAEWFFWVNGLSCPPQNHCCSFPPGSRDGRWEYVGNPRLLQFTVLSWSALTCGRDVTSLFSLGWFCSNLLRRCIKSLGGFSLKEVELPEELGLKTSWNEKSPSFNWVGGSEARARSERQELRRAKRPPKIAATEQQRAAGSRGACSRSWPRVPHAGWVSQPGAAYRCASWDQAQLQFYFLIPINLSVWPRAEFNLESECVSPTRCAIFWSACQRHCWKLPRVPAQGLQSEQWVLQVHTSTRAHVGIAFPPAFSTF